MKKLRYIGLVLLLILGLSACNDPEQEETIRQAIAALDAARERIAELETRNAELVTQVEGLIETIENDTCAEDYSEALASLRDKTNELSTLQGIVALKDFEITSKNAELEAINALYDQVSASYVTLAETYNELNDDYTLLLFQYVQLGHEYEDILPPTFIHIDGMGNETELPFYILFEYEGVDTVDFQIAYLSNDSSPANAHYLQTAYVQINKTDGSLATISFDEDLEGHTPGNWADYDPIPDGATYSQIEAEFIPWLIGRTSADLDGISVFTNSNYHGIENTVAINDQTLIDTFAGSSVSTNNMIRVMKELLVYYETQYTPE
ncbi:hypothetical protein [Candidatus Xianfuyuplasma coldseepsis]|uniref:FMN-binding domain-containing protein n=1 Tax=Candidatus Xianfuyuplasma coldseepsis TaxID=2782163 RepID=A0A7L7KSG4_9MOLU|nr:hypothetical protein [Xianfuyuplasma coldseepsis]QMS85156.1 hypothetical protein G4Z02_05150 [Xianfuyuplasma coldseepsis]